jgi:hypothetical protein
MVETADDNNTSSADRPLANDELAFVTEIVGSKERAKELLLDGVERKRIRWYCADLTINEKRDFQANPPLVTSFAAARVFFLASRRAFAH